MRHNYMIHPVFKCMPSHTFPPNMIVRGTKSMLGSALSPVHQTKEELFKLSFKEKMIIAEKQE